MRGLNKDKWYALIDEGIHPLEAFYEVMEEERIRRGLDLCEYCQAWVKPKRMARHLRRNHVRALSRHPQAP